ncbi:MAG TPA: glycerophosphodiester phosphodiesterase [Casimicrobiaceae bacterium]|nr:glycerophosphodiester phosphodiesterase [Casimicrobiaceae bacterium]
MTTVDWPYPRHCAHRGAGKLAPENTLAAMRVGFEHGYRMVEFDVKLSADGVAFLLHDDTLDRTTDGRGPAGAQPWSALSRLDAGSWHSRAFAGEALPTFAAVAQWATAHGVACNVEIKPMPRLDEKTGTDVAVASRELFRGASLPPLLSSFSEASLAAARAAASELPRALLLDEVPADWEQRLARLECVAIDPDYRQLTKSLVASVRYAGYRVVTYTPNAADVVTRLLDWGVDTVITDAVDAIPPA